MSESFWGLFVISFGVIAICFIFFFQNTTSIDEQNYTLLRESCEAAMYDAVDTASLNDGILRIDREKFIENFVRRFSEGASLAYNYKVEIYDVSEVPPKVSIKVSSKSTGTLGYDMFTFDISNSVDAILENIN